jgi:hypothetical protein
MDNIKSNMMKHYLKHYTPLIREFCDDVSKLNLVGLEKIAQPFLPLFGSEYESSPMRIVFVGQDTRGWGNARHYIDQGLNCPEKLIFDDFAEFRDHDFTGWGGSRYTFWGFVMMFLASLHGKNDWEVMKRGACKDILSSFAWGNGNAVEYYGSSAAKKEAPGETWKAVWDAGQRFNGVHHLIDVLQPHVIVVLWKNMRPGDFFLGCEYEKRESPRNIGHYVLVKSGAQVFHIPHPVNMKFTASQVWVQIIFANR